MSVVIAENACLNNPINPAHIPFLKYHPITGIYVWGFHNNDNLFIPIYILVIIIKFLKVFLIVLLV